MIFAFFQISLSEFCSLADADNCRDIFSSRSSASFLYSTVNQGNYSCSFSEIKCSGAFGPVELMCGKRQQVSIKRLNINRDIAGGCNSICVKNYAFLSCYLSNLSYRLYGSNLRACMDNRY